MTEHLPVVPGPLAILLIVIGGCIIYGFLVWALVASADIYDRRVNAAIRRDTERLRRAAAIEHNTRRSQP